MPTPAVEPGHLLSAVLIRITGNVHSEAVMAPSSRVPSCELSGTLQGCPRATSSGANPPVTLASQNAWPLSPLPFALKKTGRKVWPVDFTTWRAIAFKEH